jgi:hypothetical protein
LHQKGYSIVAVVETWLDLGISDAMLDPENRFNTYWFDRSNGIGGGVCLSVSRNILSYRTPVVLFDAVECVCATVLAENKRFNIITVYRKPGKHDVAELSEVANIILSLKAVWKLNCTNILMGDFNLPLIDWSVFQAPDDGIHLPL